MILQFLFGNRTFGAARSAQWSTIEKAHIAQSPACIVCGTLGGLLNKLNVHHILPFHLHPALELDPNNLATLCRICHFIFGHLWNWKKYNPSLIADAQAWKTRKEVAPS